MFRQVSNLLPISRTFFFLRIAKEILSDGFGTLPLQAGASDLFVEFATPTYRL
jgi:hypothetical protein